ncbi:MAG: hypothetical protein JXR68_14205 [Bacteroidales bacterium]|nr:hypothetical protein [Bacteroidales bacterium]
MTAKTTMPYEGAIKYGFILVLVIIGLIFLSKVGKMFGSNGAVNDAQKEIDTKKLNYSQSEYNSFASQLEEAFRGIGTTEAVVLSVIKKMKNASDWYALFTAFGEKKIKHGFGSLTGTLTTHLEYELSDNKSTYELVKAHINSIGVTI